MAYCRPGTWQHNKKNAECFIIVAFFFKSSLSIFTSSTVKRANFSYTNDDNKILNIVVSYALMTTMYALEN